MTIRKYYYIIIGLYAFVSIFLSDLVSEEVQHIIFPIVTIFGLILIIVSSYFLIIDEETHKVKQFDKLISSNNLYNYLITFFLLFNVASDTIQLPLIGSVFYFLISLSYLIFCIWVIINEFIRNKEITLAIIIHIFLGYYMYNLCKITYTEFNGNEIIGDFFEKPNYQALYLINLHNRDNSQVYKLPGHLHIFYESFDFDYGDGIEYETEKIIRLDTIFINDKDYLIFDDCNLNTTKEELCTDQYGRVWYLKLTKERINSSNNTYNLKHK